MLYERRLALPLTRMGEALGPDNMHTVKALPPTSWHLTTVFGPGALGRPRGIGWRGRWEGGSGWGIHVYPRLIHVNA